MAATHLTLEEAAERLGLTPEEFKRRLKTDPAFKDLDRGKIRDGSSFRFKDSAVDDLGRHLGVASDPGLPLAASDTPLESDSDDFKVPMEPERKPAPAKKPEDDPLLFSSPDEDVFSLSSEGPKPDPKKPKSGSDSDVRLEADKKKKGKKDGDEAFVPTEEIDLAAGPGSAVIKGGSSSKLSAPKSSTKLGSDSSKNLAKPGPGTGDSSEFELSLDADSSDFELKLNTDASDEVELGEMPKDTGSTASGKRGGESGINLRDPADSGISLEKGKGKPGDPSKSKAGDSSKSKSGDSGRSKAGDSGKGKGKAAAPLAEDSDSDVDFELTLDSSAAASALKLGGLKGDGKGLDADSDSEFELTLDDSSESSLEHAAMESEDGGEKRDIFETDFEIPPMDESGSEAVALESDTDLEKSDFEMEVDSDVVEEETSGSEVVLLDDEEEAPRPKKGKKTVVEDEGDVDLADEETTEDEDESVAAALKGAKGRRRDEEEEEEEAAVPAGVYRPKPWGVLPALFLLPAVVIVFVGGLLSWELLTTMWGYQQPRKPGAPLVRELAKSFNMELKDQ